MTKSKTKIQVTRRATRPPSEGKNHWLNWTIQQAMMNQMTFGDVATIWGLTSRTWEFGLTDSDPSPASLFSMRSAQPFQYTTNSGILGYKSFNNGTIQSLFIQFSGPMLWHTQKNVSEYT